jgi:hypothetical protein
MSALEVSATAGPRAGQRVRNHDAILLLFPVLRIAYNQGRDIARHDARRRRGADQSLHVVMHHPVEEASDSSCRRPKQARNSVGQVTIVHTITTASTTNGS